MTIFRSFLRCFTACTLSTKQVKCNFLISGSVVRNRTSAQFHCTVRTDQHEDGNKENVSASCFLHTNQRMMSYALLQRKVHSDGLLDRWEQAALWGCLPCSSRFFTFVCLCILYVGNTAREGKSGKNSTSVSFCSWLEGCFLLLVSNYLCEAFAAAVLSFASWEAVLQRHHAYQKYCFSCLPLSRHCIPNVAMPSLQSMSWVFLFVTFMFCLCQINFLLLSAFASYLSTVFQCLIVCIYGPVILTVLPAQSAERGGRKWE